MKTTRVMRKGTPQLFEVFGPTLEFLISPSEPGAQHCTMQGTIPPGITVPLHSHPDDESFSFRCRPIIGSAGG